MFKRMDEHFTDKRKGFWALGALGFAALWLVLWNIFPMEFYSLFFAGIIGGNIQLLLLCAVTLLPLFWLFTKLARYDLSFSGAVLVNILCLVAADYVFATFAFADKFFLCIIVLVLHIGVNIWVFGSAGVRTGKAPRGMNAPQPPKEYAIKCQPFLAVVWAAAYSFVSEAVSIGLMYIMAHIYVN